MDLVLDAVKASHEQGGEGEVGVGKRIGEADFDALGLRALAEGDAARSGPVAGRVGQQDGGFKARHQTLVGVGGRVGEGVDGLGVLDDAADVVKAFHRQTGIFVARKERLAVFPDRLVAVHARAVIAINGLGHEGCGLAVGLGDLLDAILVEQDVIGSGDHRRELDAEFVLGRGHFVVVLFDNDAHGGEGFEHFTADVLGAIDGGNREVTLLERDVVAGVAAFVIGVRIGAEFGGVDLETDLVGRGRVLHVVKQEEFGLGTETDEITDAGGLDERFGLLGDRARVAIVGLVGGGLENVAVHAQGRRREERIDIGRIVVGHQDHVGFVDGFPASDRGTVEHDAFFEHFGVDDRCVHGDMLKLAAQVGEAKVNVFDAFVLDLVHKIVC